jgi:hypothetical protein
VTLQNIVSIRWIWNGATVEPPPLVTDGDGDFSVHAARAGNTNPLVWGVTIAVSHRIGQRFAQGDFNIKTDIVVATALREWLDELHELISEWRNILNPALKRLL